MNTRQLGQLIMVGVKGTSLDKTEKKQIAEMQPSGLTLFNRNLENIEQICALNQSFIDLCEQLPIIAIDQEGGAKERLPVPPFTHWPGNAALARHYLDTGSDEQTFAQSAAIANEIKYLGFNTNFVPVLDVSAEESEDYIANRTFSADPEVVATLGLATIRGAASNNILSCAKHYPGHGDTKVDSHHDLPTIDKSAEEVRKHALIPFIAAIAAGVPMVMTTHILYPQIDVDVPATLSPTLIEDWLKKDLGFRGLVLTDDLNMQGVRKRFSPEAIAEKALLAGNHILLYCHNCDDPYNIWQYLKKSIPQSLTNILDQRLHEITTWKQTNLTQSQPNPQKVNLILK